MYEAAEKAADEIAGPASGGVRLDEIGVSGLSRFGGYVYEEFLPILRWPQAAKIYKEMSSNDPTIGGVLFAVEQLIRKTSWRVEAKGSSSVDLKAKDFLESCLEDMSTTWTDTITEVLTMIPFGHAWHEIVYKIRGGDTRDPHRRSQHNDGLFGWRRLPGRAQETLAEWKFDDDGGIAGAYQEAPPNYRRVLIPIDKSLMFRTKVTRNNPEGYSALRNAYRPWFFKTRIEILEGIGIERDLAGLPVLKPPEGVDIWNEHDVDAVAIRSRAERLVRNIRRDHNEGVVLPFGWELVLLSTGSQRQFDTSAVLNRYDQRIAVTMLADMVLLGADKVGSFALADVKKSIFAAALEAWLDSITDVFNRYGIPRLFELNRGAFPGLGKIPKLIHGEVETPSLTELARLIQAMSGAGFQLSSDRNLEDHLRETASLPRKAPGLDAAAASSGTADPAGTGDVDPAAEAEAAAATAAAAEKKPVGDGRLFSGGVERAV